MKEKIHLNLEQEKDIFLKEVSEITIPDSAYKITGIVTNRALLNNKSQRGGWRSCDGLIKISHYEEAKTLEIKKLKTIIDRNKQKFIKEHEGNEIRFCYPKENKSSYNTLLPLPIKYEEKIPKIFLDAEDKGFGIILNEYEIEKNNNDFIFVLTSYFKSNDDQLYPLFKIGLKDSKFDLDKNDILLNWWLGGQFIKGVQGTTTIGASSEWDFSLFNKFTKNSSDLGVPSNDTCGWMAVFYYNTPVIETIKPHYEDILNENKISYTKLDNNDKAVSFVKNISENYEQDLKKYQSVTSTSIQNYEDILNDKKDKDDFEKNSGNDLENNLGKKETINTKYYSNNIVNTFYSNYSSNFRGSLIFEQKKTEQTEFVTDDSWATSQGIMDALSQELEDDILLLHPDTFSIATPLSTDKEEQEQGLITCGQAINGYIGSYKGFLLERGFDKPIVMILNTTSIKPKSEKDTQATSRQHWVCCVILPKTYKIKTQEINNKVEQVIFIDSSGKQQIPEEFKNLLLLGNIKTYEIKTEEGIVKKQNISGFLPKNTQFYNSTVCQQKGGSDCGWWAVYNAIEVVKQGNTDFLNEFENEEPKYANNLRKKFPNLASKQLSEKNIKTQLNNTKIKENEEIPKNQSNFFKPANNEKNIFTYTIYMSEDEANRNENSCTLENLKFENNKKF